MLHEAYPVRYWDHDLGPGRAAPVLGRAAARARSPAGTPAAAVELRDLTPDAAPPDGAGDDFALSPDGALAGPLRGGGRRPGRTPQPASCSPRPPTASTRVLVDDPLADVYGPRFSPDGARLVCVRGRRMSTYAEPPDYTLLLVDVGRRRRRAS